jgi:hypothetical protein
MDNIKNKSLQEALNSELFIKIREARPCSTNPYRPCMLIDVPEASREAFSTPGVYATHPGAETLFTELAPYMDKYSAEYKVLADKTWQENPVRPVRKIEYYVHEEAEDDIQDIEAIASGD